MAKPLVIQDRHEACSNIHTKFMPRTTNDHMGFVETQSTVSENLTGIGIGIGFVQSRAI